MLQNAKIKIRDLKELQDENIIATQNTITPLKKCKKPKFASTTTSKKQKNKQEHEDDANNNIQNNNANINKTNTTAKKRTKFSIKNTPANQKTIDSYFTSCAKTYEIKLNPAPTPLGKQKQNGTNSTKKKTKKTPTKSRVKTGRKRLFVDTDTEPSSESNYQVECKKRGTTKMSVIECITIDSDSGDDDELEQVKIENVTLTSETQLAKTPPYKETNKGSSLKSKQQQNAHDSATILNDKRCKTTQNSRNSSSEISSILKKPKNSIMEAENSSSTNSSASSLKDKQEHIAHDSATSLNDKRSQTSQNSKNSSSEIASVSQKPQNSNTQTEIPSSTNSSVASFSRRKPKPCPPYKIIENTTFAVDAFQFGYIDNVTHYFLTHFHADHYIGLTKSFAKPLYVSPITGK